MKKTIYTLTMILATVSVINIVGCGDEEKIIVPKYELVSTKDFNYAKIIRKEYRIRVPREMTKDELTAISLKTIKTANSKSKVNAISILFYLHDSDTKGAFTAGEATWAPGGDWSKASTRLSFKLIVKAGGALGKVAKKDIVDIPIDKKKKIFMQIVRFQDQGTEGIQADAKAAKKFGITKEEAGKIALEGVIKGWPMP